MGQSRMAKKLDKLEQEAEALRKKAEKKGKDLQSRAQGRIGELEKPEKRGRKGMMTLMLAAGGAVAAMVMKKKRDQELDEALWEEPRSI